MIEIISHRDISVHTIILCTRFKLIFAPTAFSLKNIASVTMIVTSVAIFPLMSSEKQKLYNLIVWHLNNQY